jgi:hypothetical protein
MHSNVRRKLAGTSLINLVCMRQKCMHTKLTPTQLSPFFVWLSDDSLAGIRTIIWSSLAKLHSGTPLWEEREVNFQSSDSVVVVVVFWIPSRPALSIRFYERREVNFQSSDSSGGRFGFLLDLPSPQDSISRIKFSHSYPSKRVYRGSWLYSSSGKQQTTTSFITYTPQKQIMSHPHPHPIPSQPNPFHPNPFPMFSFIGMTILVEWNHWIHTYIHTYIHTPMFLL